MQLDLSSNSILPKRFRSKLKASKNGCIEFTGAKVRGGYGVLAYNKKNWRVHRLAWTLLYGRIPNNLHVLHRCDNPSCVNPKHLWLGTIQQNNEDCEKKGRRNAASGDKHGHGKLNEKKVLEIRKIRNETAETYKKLAIRFNVSEQAIYRIINRLCWKDI